MTVACDLPADPTVDELDSWIERATPPGLREVADWSAPVLDGSRHEEQLLAAERTEPYVEWEQRLLAERLVCAHWPERFGGRCWAPEVVARFQARCHLHGVPWVWRGAGDLVGSALLAFGTEEQRERLVPRIITGEDRYCQGFSEPDAGSDLANVRTRGVVDGDHLVITGHKVWTSRYRDANKIYLLCRTSSEGRRHDGLSFAIADFNEDNGVTVRPIRQMTGAETFCEDYFDGTRARLDDVVGGLGNGWRVAMASLAEERGRSDVGHLAFAHEVRDLTDLVRAIGREREPLVRQLLAWAHETVTIMRATAWREGPPGAVAGIKSSLMKLHWSEYHRRVTEVAVDLLGARSVVLDDPVVARWVDAFLATRAETIYAGSSEIQRTILAERGLGLPREPNKEKP